MVLQNVQNDDTVNCIGCYDVLFLVGRELEKGENKPSPFWGEGFMQNCAEGCISATIYLFPQTGKEVYGSDQAKLSSNPYLP